MKACWEEQEQEQEQGAFCCRICWEHESSEANLLSPCKCTGTQKHVHFKCLRRWQENVQKRDPTDERAFRCSVCRTRFSVPPPQARSSGSVAIQALRGLGGVVCISLLAFGLSGPPWPHLALLVLLLLASRSHWLPGMALLMLCSILATMHARGLRVVVKVDGGGRLGLALIRRGAPIAGIGPGVLLVASEGLDRSIFRRSVVLLTQHGRGGARGVILNQPMATPPATGDTLAATSAADGDELVTEESTHDRRSSGSSRGPASRQRQARRAAGSSGGSSGSADGGVVLKHFLGGPVGMPGEGVHHEVVVLHSLARVAGARRILPPTNDSNPNSSHDSEANSQASTSSSDPSMDSSDGDSSQPFASLPLYEGGSMSEVLERAADAAAAASAAAGRVLARRGGRLRREQGQGHVQAGDLVPAVLLFHGVCAWAEGQLEGELHAGAWRFAADPGQPGMLSLLRLPPDQLWQALSVSPHLTRVQ